MHSLEAVSPALLYAFIGLLAALENILPILPADTVVVLGAFMAGRGVLDAWIVFLVTWVANVGAAAGVYLLARRHGPAFLQSRLGRKLVPEHVMAHIQRQYERHGTYGIFLSRLLPLWRAVVPPFAGVARLSPARALIPLALASALWYGLLTFLVVRLGESFDSVMRQVGRVNRVLGAVAVVVLVVSFVLVRRRLKR